MLLPRTRTLRHSATAAFHAVAGLVDADHGLTVGLEDGCVTLIFRNRTTGAAYVAVWTDYRSGEAVRACVERWMGEGEA